MLNILTICLTLYLGVLVTADHCVYKSHNRTEAYAECTGKLDDIELWIENSIAQGHFNKTNREDFTNMSSLICSRFTIEMNCDVTALDAIGDDCLFGAYKFLIEVNMLKRYIVNYFCANDGEVLKEFFANNGYNSIKSENIRDCFTYLDERHFRKEDHGVIILNQKYLCSTLERIYFCIRNDETVLNENLNNVLENLHTVVYDALKCLL